MDTELAWVVLLPLMGATLCSIAGRRWAAWLGCLAAASTALAAATLAVAVGARGTLTHELGGWRPPLGIGLRADGLAATLVVSIALVASAIGAHVALDRRSAARSAPGFLALWLFAWGALNALVLSADIFNMYVTLELSTLAAIGLISFDGRRAALRAALRYLLVALAGSLVYLLGVALLYAAYATLDLRLLGARLRPDALTSAAFALVTLGLGLKTGLFPLHGWVPATYAGAHPAVTAFISSLVGKAAFIIYLRLWFEVLPPALAGRAGPLLGALGAAGVVFGSLAAARSKKLKVILAYSSVAQVGYLFLPFALGGKDAWAAGVFLVCSHAAAKAAAFLAVAGVQSVGGGDAIDGLKGLARHHPVTFFALALAGVSLMGMPPSGGFIAKWLLVRAAIERGQWWWAALILVGGLLGAGYVFRMLRVAFLPGGEEPRAGRASTVRELPALLLALMALGLGIAPSPVLRLLGIGGPP